MSFEEYINNLRKVYTLVKVDDNEYILHKDRKTLKITPFEMYNEEEINSKLNLMYKSHIGEDDLYPPINKKPNKPKGSIFSPKDLEDQEEDLISKSDIFPLKKKQNPDNDHFKKDGGDDDNMFMYLL